MSAAQLDSCLRARRLSDDEERFGADTMLPLVIEPSTYATAGLVVVVAAMVSGWAAWRRLDRMEIIEVLKTRD